MRGSRESSYGRADASRKADAPNDDLNARAERWLRTRDPSELWPGLDVRALDPAADAIESSVACCLDGRRSSLGRADGADAGVIGIAALLLGVGPLLGYWIERGLLDVSAPLADILAAHLRHGRGRMLRITNGVRPVVNALMAAGIAPVMIKGFHSAHAYFPEPAVRPFFDVDLVVGAAEVEDAERILSSLGCVGGEASLPFKRRWCAPGVDRRIRSFELWHEESPWLLELHGGLFFSDLHRYGLNFGEAPTDVCNMGGIEARVLRPPLRLVATAAHCSFELHSMRLLRLVEMILAIRATDAPDVLDWGAVQDVLDRSHATRFVYPAFAWIEQLAPGTVPARVLDRARQASSRLERYVVANVRPGTPALSTGQSFAELLMWASSPAEFFSPVGRLLGLDLVGMSWSEAFRVWESRWHRLFTGRVTVWLRRWRSDA
jgi:hypothetical protein